MEVILEWVQVLLPTTFALIAGWLGGKLKEHKGDVKRLEDKQDANNKATLCLVRKTIIDFYDLYVRHQAPMTIERVHEVTDLYQAYKGLNGNGVVDRMYDELMDLPIMVVNKQEVPLYDRD